MIERFRKKCIEKKAKVSKDKFVIETAKMQAKTDKLTRSENKKEKKKIGNLQTELKSINRRHTEEVKMMETNYQHKILELEEDLANAKSGSPDEDFNKDGKGYGFKMRVLVYECLVANAPTEQIPGLIKTFAKCFNMKLKGVHGRSTVENMLVELGLISDFQVASLLYNSRNVTIAFDATTHVNEIHATTKEKCLVMSLEELAGGTAKDYANHIIKSVEHLAQTLCTFRVEEQSISVVNKTLQSRITCSMTDRAVANHAAIRIVNEAFKTTLLEVNCHLHPLDTIATKCRSTLKSLEHGIEKSKLFGQGCRADKVILALNKMRFKDGKGDPHGFRAFLRDYNLPQSVVASCRYYQIF